VAAGTTDAPMSGGHIYKRFMEDLMGRKKKDDTETTSFSLGTNLEGDLVEPKQPLPYFRIRRDRWSPPDSYIKIRWREDAEMLAQRLLEAAPSLRSRNDQA